MALRAIKLILLCVVIATACETSEKRRVRDDFSKEHPDYTIVSIGEPDGNDTSVVTFFIVYKKPGDKREFWSDWGYETKNHKFELVGKGTENVYSTDSRR